MQTILVIEDHPVTLETICLILKREGYKALSAQNAQQAQEQFFGNKVDLVIVDHGLPGISGTQLANVLKTTNNVLVMMLSGNSELLERSRNRSTCYSLSQFQFLYCWPRSRTCLHAALPTEWSRFVVPDGVDTYSPCVVNTIQAHLVSP